MDCSIKMQQPTCDVCNSPLYLTTREVDLELRTSDKDDDQGVPPTGFLSLAKSSLHNSQKLRKKAHGG